MSVPESGFAKPISNRAVVDLPHPDSPTIPSVSPLWISTLMSSTACTTTDWPTLPPAKVKCLVKFLAVSIGWCGSPTSRRSRTHTEGRSPSTATIAATLSRLHVHRIPESVAHQVEAHGRYEDHDPRQYCVQGRNVDRLPECAQ